MLYAAAGLLGLVMTLRIWPDLPLSIAANAALLRLLAKVQAKLRWGIVLLTVAAALLVLAVFAALQGDAPLFLTMLLPELAAWAATFEIATLAEALVGAATIFIAAKASGIGLRFRQLLAGRRRRDQKSAVDKGARRGDGDRPQGFRWQCA